MDILVIEQKFEEIKSLFEGDVQKAAQVAVPITLAIEKALTGQAAIEVESFIPNGAAYGAAVLSAVKAMEPALTALADPKSTFYTPDGVKGLLQRLGSQITLIIHGGKQPFGFYVKAFEIVFDN